MRNGARAPAAWSAWQGTGGESTYTLGVEEEVMLVDPSDWSLAQRIDEVLPRLSDDLRTSLTRETHSAAVELETRVQPGVDEALAELCDLRRGLDTELGRIGLRVASAGTHPSTVWSETEISKGERYQFVYGSMRELARREPTFALHVHVGIATPDDAIVLVNRLRCHLPLLLALSVNSPFWQGRDTGLASARIPLFQAFPRVGIPRRFRSYADYVDAVDTLIRCDAFPEPTFLWWDVRPQPRFGTVEVRILDAQTTVDETAALVALVQSVARLEVEEPAVSPGIIDIQEVLDENRFIAARDGMDGKFVDPARGCRVPAREFLAELLEVCEPHARDLGCERHLANLRGLAERTGADLQLEAARRPERLAGLVRRLADAFPASERGGFARLDTSA